MLSPVVIRAPGFGGLNLEGEEINANPRFARIAKNIVFDNAGRLASRKGYTQTNDTVAGDVQSIFVFDYSGGTKVITGMGADIYSDATDETGSLTPSGNHWQFQNFNDKVVGCQSGETAIVWDGGGGTNFAAIAPKGGGTVDANGNCLHSAFGRLWATNSAATTLYWCGLLDETEWPSATTPGDSGSLNILSNEAAVRSGYDEIVAINHIQDKLVVFLRNSIVILDSPEDPANMTIFKTLDNIGCIARDSVQAVGNDLVFLSRDGLRSLARAVAEDNFPLRDLSRHVRGDLLAALSGSPNEVKGMYYPDEGIYILLFTGNTAWVFDFKRAFEDGLPRVTTWEVPKWHSLYYHEGTLYIGQEGEYGTYTGYQDDGVSYQFQYESVNVDFDRPEIKNLKLTQAAFKGADDQQITFTYNWDYGNENVNETTSIPAQSSGGIYGTGTYGSAVYGTGVTRAEVRVSPFGSGEVLSFGLKADVNGSQLVLEQLSHFATIGRIRR
jgi:hypothetical protein